jgi:AcrR family transcriptional regulator
VTAVTLPATIADATLLAVHEHGVERLTFEHVARQADVPLEDVRSLAPTPAALAAGAMEQSYEAWRDQVPAWLPIPDGGSLADGLTTILRDTFRHLQSPGFLQLGHLLMLRAHTSEPDEVEQADDVPDPRSTFLQFRGHAEDEFTAWFRHAIERDPTLGPQQRGTDRLCAQIVLLSIDGFVAGHRIDGGADPDAHRAVLVDIVVSALRA